jgi:hypothetical protein
MLQKAALTGRFFWTCESRASGGLFIAFPGRKAVAAEPICEHQIGQMLV